MNIFLIISCCTALKLSDPASLRDVEAENISLRAWCAGVGCVMPFTPASCLSWCDWNFDKQADAEARGAFAGIHWGEKKRKQATDFGIVLGSTFKTAVNGVVPCNAEHTMHFVDPNLDHSSRAANYAPIFPGGDSENTSGDTYLQCEKCYAIQGLTSSGVIGAEQYHIKFTKEAAATFGGVPAAGKVSRVLIYHYNKDHKCGRNQDIKYSFDVAALTSANKGKKETGKMKWEEGTGGACIKYSVKDIDKADFQLSKCANCLVLQNCDANAKTACDAKVNLENGVSTANKHSGMTAGTETAIGFGLSGGLLYPACKA